MDIPKPNKQQPRMPLPVWIRAPQKGPEYYTGFTRAYLYVLKDQGKIVSRSIKEPGQLRGVRLFNLQSILDFIESHGKTEGLK